MIGHLSLEKSCRVRYERIKRAPSQKSLWTSSQKSFWTKIHKFNENFGRYKCPNWLLEIILLELNQRIKMDMLEKNYERKVKKIIVKIIKDGNTNLLLKFLNEGIYMPKNVVIDTLINTDTLTWNQDYLDGLNLPKDFIISNLWIDAIGKGWQQRRKN